VSGDEAQNLYNRHWIPDVVALAVVAGATAATIWALTWLTVLDSPWVAGLIVVPVLVGAALYSWYVSDSGRKADSEKWRMGAIALRCWEPYPSSLMSSLALLPGITTILFRQRSTQEAHLASF
jgi:hypothetical protein